MANSDGYNYTENLAQVRERLATLEQCATSTHEDIREIKEAIKDLDFSGLKRDVSINKWLSRVNLTALLGLAGKMLADLFGV